MPSSFKNFEHSQTLAFPVTLVKQLSIWSDPTISRVIQVSLHTFIVRSSVVNSGVFFLPEIIVTDINLNDRSSRVASVKTTNILLIVLVVVIVMLRLFSRLIILKNVFLEDGMLSSSAGVNKG